MKARACRIMIGPRPEADHGGSTMIAFEPVDTICNFPLQKFAMRLT